MRGLATLHPTPSRRKVYAPTILVLLPHGAHAVLEAAVQHAADRVDRAGR
jgi:hypothetical protein